MYKHNLIFIFLFLTSFWFHKSHSKNSLIKSIKIGKVSSVNSWRKTCYTCKGKSFIMFFKTIEYNESANKTVLVPRLRHTGLPKAKRKPGKSGMLVPIPNIPPTRLQVSSNNSLLLRQGQEDPLRSTGSQGEPIAGGETGTLRKNPATQSVR